VDVVDVSVSWDAEPPTATASKPENPQKPALWDQELDQ
jgi:hypothetical protein